MVDILPGGYCNQIKTSLFFSINVYSHYSTYVYNIHKGSKALTHRDYWLDPDDPWIYITPNELNRW